MLIAVVVVGLLVPAVASFVVVTVRASTMAEHRATAAAAVMTSAALVADGRLGDACDDPGAYRDVLADRLALGEPWVVDVVAECSSEWPALVTVTLTDPRGTVTAVTAVEGGLS